MPVSPLATLDLSRWDELRSLAGILADVRKIAPEVDLMVVGALARDLLLHYGHGVAIGRGTEDADFGIAVADWQEFHALREALIARGPFTPQRGSLHRLRYRAHGWIDLIPFGGVERPDGTIAWPPSGDVVMRVLAYSEASAAATSVALPHFQSVKVVSLPMLAAMKLLAWQDRHRTAPLKDAKDLYLILDNYLDAGNRDRLYAETELLQAEEFDYEKTGAWLAARDLRMQIGQHSTRARPLLETMLGVLQAQLDPVGDFALIAQMSDSDADKAAKAERLLTAFESGLKGSNTP